MGQEEFQPLMMHSFIDCCKIFANVFSAVVGGVSISYISFTLKSCAMSELFHESKIGGCHSSVHSGMGHQVCDAMWSQQQITIF
jgi:hypothetical protein